jgi:hypothetical protein
MVRREYELHGEVDDWTKEEVVRWVNRDFSGSNLKDPQALLSSVEDILADPGETDRAWRKEGGSCVPNASGLHDILVRENKDVLKRESDAHEVDEITKQTLRKYVDLISELKLEELRREAGLSSDK